MSDPYDLQRFVDAQNPVYDRVCFELREGRKGYSNCKSGIASVCNPALVRNPAILASCNHLW